MANKIYYAQCDMVRGRVLRLLFQEEAFVKLSTGSKEELESIIDFHSLGEFLKGRKAELPPITIQSLEAWCDKQEGELL